MGCGMNTSDYDVMLIDPSTPDGEEVLGLTEPGRRIVLLLMLAGPAAAALIAHANNRRTSLAEAADEYLAGLRGRLTDRGLSVKEWVKVMGSDATGAVAQLAGELPGSRVLLPSDTMALGHDDVAHLSARLNGNVVVAPRRAG